MYELSLAILIYLYENLANVYLTVTQQSEFHKYMEILIYKLYTEYSLY